MAKILLGVSSSISIYKSLDLVSRLKKAGHEVWPILTSHAAELVSPALFHALSGNGVESDPFAAARRGDMTHINLGRGCDLFIVCPATANTLARLACGLADDLLGTSILAHQGPVLVAPAMNPGMWAQPIVQENVARLRARGWHFVDPDEGPVACGDWGVGRLAGIDRVEAEARKILDGAAQSDAPLSALRGKRVLVTAGGAREALDPVRVLTNRSSGRMAKSIAEALLTHGARVLYLEGQVEVPAPSGVERIAFESTADLKARLEERIGSCDALVMAAAPADFTPAAPSPEKIKRTGELTLRLVPTPDILAGLAKRPGQVFLGFAAETQELLGNAAAKLQAKNLDLIVANRAGGLAGGREVGIGAEDTEFAILSAAGVQTPLHVASKAEAAREIVCALAGALAT
ncbi:MAG: bifunctional phosphopantothenoylcysteine decarboxylase/phosphopantothenate--cysteine ligase CoaBC [Spirochaetes bacterium]|nr:bifunctional phosphopantothenoylcysteine decarboxylase/phosphopantothenate--cysteine ligase CoaBC [Spirochaetota bacterium]